VLGVKVQGRAAMACGGDPFSVETYACASNLLPNMGDSMKYDLGLNLLCGAAVVLLPKLLWAE